MPSANFRNIKIQNGFLTLLACVQTNFEKLKMSDFITIFVFRTIKCAREVLPKFLIFSKSSRYIRAMPFGTFKYKMADLLTFLFTQIDQIFKKFVCPDEYLKHQWNLPMHLT